MLVIACSSVVTNVSKQLQMTTAAGESMLVSITVPTFTEKCL
jgi:hypothetical protein